MTVLLMLIITLATSWQFTQCIDTAVNFKDWFQQLNSDLSSIYQQSAHFAWELR